MKEACRNEGLDVRGHDKLHKVNPWEYFINHKYKITWCNVFKSASTSWMYIFNILGGYSPEFLKTSKAVPLNLARKKYGRPSTEDLLNVINRENFTSVIIGR